MALYSNLNRCFYRYYLRSVCNNLPKYPIQNVNEKPFMLEVNSLDDFTSQLMRHKMDKWSGQKTRNKLTIENINKEPTFDDDINYISVTKIDSLFQELIVMGDNSGILDLIAQCIKYRKCPSLSNLTYVLTLCAQSGDKTTIIQIEKLCGEFHPDILKANSNFHHFLAEAIWVKGNVSESLKLFKEVYVENAFLRRRIRLTFKNLMSNVISNRSEAALVNIIKFADDLLKDYQDSFPLGCVWQACFLSEWYSDQSMALDLLEKSDGFRNAIVNQIPYVVSISLSQHRIDVVYRLLEILIKYKMITQYSGILLSLLDYQVRHGDVRSCLEIIQWSTKNNIELPIIHCAKFLDHLVSCHIKMSTRIEKAHVLMKQKTDMKYKF